MAKTPKKVSDLYIKEQNKDYLKPEYLEATSGVVGAGQFYSEITNRAPMIDLSQDLGVRFGVNRFQTQQVYKIKDEVGPNGELVYGFINDKYNQFRAVGNWGNANGTNGPYIANGSTANEFVEITFYGTGLNLLLAFEDSARDWQYSVDGGLESSANFPNGSLVLNARNYASNHVLPIVNGLTLGIHTVKIRTNDASSFGFGGYEILNERTDLLVPKGFYFNDGKLLRLTAEQNTDYASGFTNEYGTAGTKGGCVSVYLTENGLIRKDVQYTDVTAQYLTNADHVNEEIISTYSPREFGAGRADDFSTLVASTSDRAFTLDDGTTTLVANDCQFQETFGRDSLTIAAIGGYFEITFIGTGLDIETVVDSSAMDTTVSVDGVSVQSGTGALSGEGIVKICSGLPYGTHTVRITRNDSVGSSPRLNNAIVYGPKKPEIEDSSIELASYYLLSNYSDSVVGVSAVSSGVVRKLPTRENLYIGNGWVTLLDPTFIGGVQVYTVNNTNDYTEYTFFGTGVDCRFFVQTSVDVTFSIDGDTDLTNYTINYRGSGTLTQATGQLAGNNQQNEGLSITGLPLGIHTIRINKDNASGNAFAIEAFDVITPIHTPKINGPFSIQNTLRVGSQSVGDSRNLSKENSFVAINKLISSYTFGSGSTTAPTPVVNTIRTTKNKIKISVSGTLADVNAGGADTLRTFFYLDGKLIGVETNAKSPNADENTFANIHVENVSKGEHIVQLFFWGSGGSGIRMALCQLTVEEID